MAEFKYTATNPDGIIMSETLVAESEEEVILILSKDNLELINIQELEEAQESLFDRIFNRVTNTDKAQFLEYFASMLEAGLTVDDALQAFYEDLDKPLLRKFVKETQYKVRNGKALSDCFLDFPEIFSPMFSGMIRVGETGGTLDNSFKQLAIQVKKSNAIRSKVRNAMMYPALLMIVMLGLATMLVMFVFPRLEEFFLDTGLELPGLTRAILDASALFRNYWYVLIILFFGFNYLRKYLLKKQAVREKLGKWALKVPIFGSLNRTTNVALFTRILGTLLTSGVNILESLDVLKLSMGNASYSSLIDSIKEDITKGNSLADSIKKFPDHFAPFEIRVLSISDRTGGVAEGLSNIAEFYETKLFDMLAGLSATLEPVMLIVMGGAIAVLALSVITPIYSLLGGIDGL